MNNWRPWLTFSSDGFPVITNAWDETCEDAQQSNMNIIMMAVLDAFCALPGIDISELSLVTSDSAYVCFQGHGRPREPYDTVAHLKQYATTARILYDLCDFVIIHPSGGISVNQVIEWANIACNTHHVPVSRPALVLTAAQKLTLSQAAALDNQFESVYTLSDMSLKDLPWWCVTEAHSMKRHVEKYGGFISPKNLNLISKEALRTHQNLDYLKENQKIWFLPAESQVVMTQLLILMNSFTKFDSLDVIMEIISSLFTTSILKEQSQNGILGKLIMHKFSDIKLRDNCIGGSYTEQNALNVLEKIQNTNTAQNLSGIVRRMFTFYSKIVKSRLYALAIHKANLLRARSIIQRIETTEICLTCILRRPDFQLPCNHSLCEICARDQAVAIGQPESAALEISRCLTCDEEFIPPLRLSVLPKTAGISLLSIDGGGVRIQIPMIILKALHEHLDIGLQPSEMWDFAAGSSAGIEETHSV